MNDQSETIKQLNLGQGNTPLIRLYNLEKKLSWKGQLWAKCEYQNPTGSFKDRGSVAEILKALKENKKGIVCASTGNMAASLSAYAARASLRCIVVLPKGTPNSKLQQAIITGAKLVAINGNYDSCVGKAEELAKEKNYLLCGDYETRRIGQRMIGEELAQSKVKIDGFICPVGNGTVGCAISEGFATYKKYPTFIGVQGKGADPLVQAFNKTLSPFTPIRNPQTVASAMNVGNPLDGEITLYWIRKTKGQMISVTDKEILSAQKYLATTEGIFVEPAAAATIVALFKLSQRTTNLVVILTGHGLKGGVLRMAIQDKQPRRVDPKGLRPGEFGDTISTQIPQRRRPEERQSKQQVLRDKFGREIPADFIR